MSFPLQPLDEPRRLALVRRYRILDTPPEPAFDELVKFAADLCHTPAAFISLIDGTREWFKAHVGFDASYWKRSLSFSENVLAKGEFWSVRDTLESSFADHPLVQGEPRIRFFAATPLMSEEGAVLGVLGVFDTGPRELSYATQRHLCILGRQCVAQLELRRRRANDGETGLTGDSDATERADHLRQAQNALQESEFRFRQLVENVREVYWMTDAHRQRLFYISPRAEEIWSFTAAELMAEPQLWLESIYEKDRARIASVFQRAAIREVEEQYRIVRSDGSLRWVRDRSFPVKDAEGKVYRITGVIEDITEQRRMEDQFRQSQKMEAIGQLAGGVAHDFNNLVTVISGNASLLLMEDDLSEGAKLAADEIIQAAERATGLTRQLLLFSRKQTMQPCILDLNAIVGNMTKMLQRILGEDIALRADFSPKLPRIYADAGMIEQVLLNLAVNSRDSMPAGGRLIISTSSVLDPDGEEKRAEPLVCLAVSDNGCGIPPDVLPRIFEPFFTTKEEGKGTGLGLATVYGIVLQHHGKVTVESDPKDGTTFRIMLPAAEGDAAEVSDVGGVTKMPGGSETILLVEDEPSLRALSTQLLQLCGYSVYVASNGLSALEVWMHHKDRIQLLVTDVIMPDGMSGRELAGILQAEKEQLKVIYTSGYSPEAIGMAPESTNGSQFLQKPYRVRQLAEAVRQCLDEVGHKST